MLIFVRVCLLILMFATSVLHAQTAVPVILGRQPVMLPPAIDATGRTVIFASAVTPDGVVQNATDLYTAQSDATGLRRLTRFPTDGPDVPQGITAVSLSSGGTTAAYTTLLRTSAPGGEQVRAMNLTTGVERTLHMDTEGCILPLRPECPACFFTCLHTPHVTDDGGRVLFAASRERPFYTVATDGTGLARLPIYSGALAPAPQRVISRNGLVVFTSAAPHGPTFAPSATDIYVMNLDGASIRAVTRFGNNATLYATNATISADGGIIAFESNRDPETGRPGSLRHIYVIRSDGTGLRALTANVVCLALNCPVPGGASPSISGDGAEVAFVNGGRIALWSSTRSHLQMLATFRMSSAQDPAISDDGSRVVFPIGPRDGGRGAIYSVRTDGADLRAVYAPRALNPNGVVGIVSGTAPSPGSLFSVYGLNLGSDDLRTAENFPLPVTLATTSLVVNSRAAPLLAVTPWQINSQLPMEIGEGQAAFQLRFADGATTASVNAEVKNLAPAIFTYSVGVMAQAAVFHANSGVPADPANPAVAGEVVEIYGTGLGVTAPLVAAGSPAPSPPARTVVVPEVLFGNQAAQVTFSGLAPGLAGVYQVNAFVPTGLPAGQHVVRWRIGQNSSFGFGTVTVR